MIKLNIQTLLEQKGKSKYWLYNQLGMGYSNFKRLINNQTTAIKFENIKVLCWLLECTPNELFTIQLDR